MPVRTRKAKPAPQETEVVEELDTPEAKAAKLKAETDAMLDEIDSVLEENAEEFVRNYVQKGGE